MHEKVMLLMLLPQPTGKMPLATTLSQSGSYGNEKAGKYATKFTVNRPNVHNSVKLASKTGVKNK